MFHIDKIASFSWAPILEVFLPVITNLTYNPELYLNKIKTPYLRLLAFPFKQTFYSAFVSKPFSELTINIATYSKLRANRSILSPNYSHEPFKTYYSERIDNLQYSRSLADLLTFTLCLRNTEYSSSLSSKLIKIKCNVERFRLSLWAGMLITQQFNPDANDRIITSIFQLSNIIESALCMGQCVMHDINSLNRQKIFWKDIKYGLLGMIVSEIACLIPLSF